MTLRMMPPNSLTADVERGA